MSLTEKEFEGASGKAKKKIADTVEDLLNTNKRFIVAVYGAGNGKAIVSNVGVSQLEAVGFLETSKLDIYNEKKGFSTESKFTEEDLI